MTKIIVTNPTRAVNDPVAETVNFTHDLGTVAANSTNKFTLSVKKETQEGKLASACWCSAAMAKGTTVDVEMYARGNSGSSQERVLNGYYADKSKYSITIKYKVK